MSANAEAVATAIATYLVEVGVHEIADQIAAIRRSYATSWKTRLTRHGFDVIDTFPVSDFADGVDLALARLMDAAQTEYDAALTTPTAGGKTQPAAHYLGAVNTPATGGQ